MICLKVAEEVIEKGFDGSDVAKMKGEVNTNSWYVNIYF